MAGSSLLLLIDDIATILDDVAAMSKIAVKKTAGVLGDDLAVNAQQVSGVKADRELPVVWAVARGSFRNKLILVPAALLVSVVAPWLITPVLMLGGLFLCYEGFEKLAHSWGQSREQKAEHQRELVARLEHPAVDLLQLERSKIKGAVRTDFILSAEIIVITLGTVASADFTTQVLVVAGIALLMTVGVYGLVAAIVKLDDGGLYLSRREGTGGWPRVQRQLGRGLLAFAPVLMKTLGVVGTIAMFMVGGGILVHGIAPLHHGSLQLAQVIGGWPWGGAALGALAPTLLAGIAGVLAGALVFIVTNLVQRLRRPAKPA